MVDDINALILQARDASDRLRGVAGRDGYLGPDPEVHWFAAPDGTVDWTIERADGHKTRADGPTLPDALRAFITRADAEVAEWRQEWAEWDAIVEARDRP